MAGDQTIIKQGYVLKWMKEADKKKSVWQKLFFVLHGPSLKNAARLDWYDSEKQFRESPGTRKALFLEEIKGCQKISYTQESKELYGSSAKYLLMIQTSRTAGAPNYVLKFSSQDLLTEWCDHLTELLRHDHAVSVAAKTAHMVTDPDYIYIPDVSEGSSSYYEVHVDDTGAAVGCGLKGLYRLLLSQQSIVLVDPDNGNHVITWMYKHIRRFGYCENSLSIEGGAKCGIGQGLFIFITDRGGELMTAINERMQLYKNSREENVSGKQSSQQKPLINMNGKAVPSNQTKMSEVLPMLLQHNLQDKEDDLYDYSRLDLRGAQPKPYPMDDLENPYGEVLVQKIKDSK